MEVLAQVGGSILSGIVESLIKKVQEMELDDLVDIQSKLSYALQELKRSLSMVKELVSNADKRAYNDDDKYAKDWLERLQDATYDVDKILDELEYKKLKRLYAESQFTNYYHSHSPIKLFERAILKKINDIQQRIKQIFKDGKTYKVLKSSTDGSNSQGRTTTSSINNIANVFGRDAIRDEIVQLLTKEDPIACDKHDIMLNVKNVPILPIVGIGGIGKTTLAQMIINHEKVINYFDLKIWVCVSNEFDEKKIIKQILESIHYSKRKFINTEGENMKVNRGDVNVGNYENFDVLTKALEDAIKASRFLLVLDDVWNEDPMKWKRIENCFMIDDANKGSKILVTTRNQLVASIMSSSNPIHLDGLENDVFWPLFKQCAFGIVDEHPRELEEIGKEIMRKLKGSPLAAKTIGHILRSSPSKIHWETILNSKMWNLKQDKSGIMPALRLSYQYLPEHLKPCFAFCSLYPKDYIYEKRQIVCMWISLDYIQNQDRNVPTEEIGEEYVNELLERSMFQSCTMNDVSVGDLTRFDAKEVFKIHDLIHDLAKMISANESLMIEDEDTRKQLSSSIRNISIFVDNENWNWNGRDGFGQLNNIRTLILLSKNKMVRKYISSVTFPLYDFLQKVVVKMKFLRVLDLSYIYIGDYLLPKLKHLRYLDLYSTSVLKLPGSFENLFQLQVLNCDGLYSPPQIKFMKHLRHIRGFHVNTSAVQNLENFHFLQEVELDVSEQHSSFSTKGKRRDKLKILRDMKWMRELSIYKLENLDSKEEALEAELKSMDRLTKLTLSWGYVPETERSNHEEILDALHPGPNVAVLRVEAYGGVEFPSWMENLSFLRELEVNWCWDVKFIRTRELNMIKHLRFCHCWKMGIQDGTEGFRALTCLEKLDISGCPQLVADLFEEGRGGLPSSLKEMRLDNDFDTVINVSSTILQSLTNLTHLSARSRGVGFWTNSPETQQLHRLKEFELDCKDAQQLKGWLLNFHGCISLGEITIRYCRSLECFDNEMEDALVSFASLRKLSLCRLKYCRSLPKRLCEISSLKELVVWDCSKIECLPEKGLPSGLKVLHIHECPLLKEHVEKVRHLLPKQLHAILR